MIYCNLKGGLGNMLFQIAAAISLAEKNKTIASFPNLHNHLNFLNEEVNHLPDLKHAHEYLNIFSSLITIYPKNRLPVFSYPFHFEEKPITNDCWIDGFFQSEKYFIDHKNLVLKSFNFGNVLIEDYLKYFKDKTISIHFRRGDYLKNYSHHPVLDMSYYEKSLEAVGEYDHLFVFSDDIEWARNNLLNNKKAIFVNEKDYISLFLMSKCNHNIIANSSFSWWGAWLNQNKDKIVICPSKWFGSALSNLNSSDICCEGWQLL